MDEFEKIRKRSECSGEGDCENCSCWGSCSYGITPPDEYNYDDTAPAPAGDGIEIISIDEYTDEDDE